MKDKFKSLPSWLKLSIIVGLFLLLSALVSLFAVNRWYQSNLNPKGGNQEIVISIPLGSSSVYISDALEEEGVISSSTAFNWYLQRHGIRSDLQAGTYRFNTNQSVQEIAEMLVNGEIDTSLFTISPGQYLDELKASFREYGWSKAEVDKAFSAKYSHPLMKFKPAKASLEGYIFPETFQVTSTSSPEDVLEQSFDALYSKITSKMKKQIKAQGLSMHEAFILSSIVFQESGSVKQQSKIAGVFYNRLDEGIVLGSDVTFIYASEQAGVSEDPTIDSPYNTRIYGGLPPGPISNFQFSALQAVAKPANHDYLYFVAGDDGNIYYSSTLAEHESLTERYCKEGCLLQ